jgi:hypothetical protein
MLGVMYGSLVAPTALLPHLALQLYTLGMLRRNTTLCSATLLSHPTAAGRLRVLVSLLDCFAMAGEGRAGGQRHTPARSRGAAAPMASAPASCRLAHCSPLCSARPARPSGNPSTALLLRNRAWQPTAAHDCRLFLCLNEVLVGMVLPTLVLVRYLPTVATARLRRLHAAGASKSVLYRAELVAFLLFGGRRDWGLAPGERPASWGASQLAMVWWCMLSLAWVLATSVLALH